LDESVAGSAAGITSRTSPRNESGNAAEVAQHAISDAQSLLFYG